MKNLVKIGLTRLYKNFFYILGCVLAVVITNWFLVTTPIPQLAHHSKESVAILLSGAILLFFSFFVGLFMGNENEDGILRNKVIAGHTQMEIYISNYITLLVAMLVMLVCWMVGAVLGGVSIGKEILVYSVVAIFYNAAFIAIVQALVFRIKKQVTGIVISMAYFYLLLTSVLFGNLLYMLTAENTLMSTVVVVFYNISALGQCFARTALADPGLANSLIQIPVSVVVIMVATVVGTLGLRKRDIN